MSALANGILYASDRREMFAVRPGNGAVLWRVTLTNDLRAGEVTSLIISNSVAYTTVGDSTSETVVTFLNFAQSSGSVLPPERDLPKEG